MSINNSIFFIKAYYLKSISSLAEGIPVKFNTATDFAVLCSNCHRMIHKMADPSDLESFRKLIFRSVDLSKK